MFLIDTVLAGSVEVELSKLVRVGLGDQSAVGHDNLEARAEVLKLSVVDAGDVEVHAASGGVVDIFGDDVDGGLVLAGRTGNVGRFETVPDHRTAGVGVVEGVDINSAVSCTGHERSAVKARSRHSGQKGEDGSDNLHCD